MAKFYIHGESYNDGSKKVFVYDNEFSTITERDGTPIDLSAFQDYKGNHYHRMKQFSVDHPVGKSTKVSKMKIQLGLKCNYSCEYCSQATHVEGSVDFTPKNIDTFMSKLDVLDLSGVDRIEYWGGEPLVYWKTIKQLTLRLKEKYPHIGFLIITNGSMFSEEINDFLVEHDFAVGISHDGPGQSVRGPDPFKDPERMIWIQDLYDRLSPKGRISFNCILSKGNSSRLDIYNFFKDIFGDNVRMGEGYFLYVTHDGGDELSLYDYQDMIAYRRQAFNELSMLDRSKVYILDHNVTNFIQSIVNGRNFHTVGQRCGMDRETHLSIDMNGDVLSCQNVSANTSSYNGKSHTLGNISDMDNVKLNTGTHWSLRKNCPECPVLQLCSGSCFLLQDDYWERSCDNAYNDVVPFFMYAFEILTGYIPYWIDGNIPEWRKDVLGMNNPELTRKRPKVIPIKAI